MTKTERTAEGQTWYRMIDLVLARDRMPALTRTWGVLHPIDERSPLCGADSASLQRDEVEITVLLTGVDDTSMQPVHARKRHLDHEVRYGVRPADMLYTRADGALVLDVSRFHELVPVERADRQQDA